MITGQSYRKNAYPFFVVIQFLNRRGFFLTNKFQLVKFYTERETNMKAILKGIIPFIVFPCFAYTQVLPWRTLLRSGASNFMPLEEYTHNKAIYTATFHHLTQITNNGNTFDTIIGHALTTLLALDRELLFGVEYGGIVIPKSTCNRMYIRFYPKI